MRRDRLTPSLWIGGPDAATAELPRGQGAFTFGPAEPLPAVAPVVRAEPVPASPIERWRVVWVLDTRDRDDARKPIPGTGDKRNCEDCGRAHEVHALVETTSRSRQMVVGVSCARKLRGVWGGLSGNYVVDKAHPNYSTYRAKLDVRP